MQADAFAKVNLDLRVRSRDASGMHPLRSLAASVNWTDRLALHDAETDRFTVSGEAPPGEDNLAWRALEAVRRTAGTRQPISLELVKQIPSGAGLGGGSADAAAVLGLAGERFALTASARDALAPDLGADVMFCLDGGLQWMEGYGEDLTPLLPGTGFSAAIVVPQPNLSTPDVYRRWDELGEPQGPVREGRQLPVSLRDLGPFRNDLTPAAIDLAPELGDLLTDLTARWATPVAMSGSGSALFGLFPSLDEAAGAVAETTGMRAGRACAPMPSGWVKVG